MTTQAIAERLVELCRRGDFHTAQKELYASDAVSIEPSASAGFEKETKGLEAIFEKSQKWDSMLVETHGMTVSDPLVADNSFACTILMDVTMKQGGRVAINELCVYKVKDGKVVSEEFLM